MTSPAEGQVLASIQEAVLYCLHWDRLQRGWTTKPSLHVLFRLDADCLAHPPYCCCSASKNVALSSTHVVDVFERVVRDLLQLLNCRVLGQLLDQLNHTLAWQSAAHGVATWSDAV